MSEVFAADVVVIAGTVDARNIIEELVKLNIGVAATVTTGFGSELLQGYPGIQVFEGKLSDAEMTGLLGSTRCRCLVDASHPYAREASQNAIKACNAAGIPYIRYERNQTRTDYAGVIKVGDFEEAAEMAASREGNILLTIGSNNIGVFTGKIPDYKDRLFARILPDSRMLAKCEAAGLTANNIIAIKGPFSEAMNIEMLKHCNARILVTKDSGEAGGTLEKLNAAKSLDVTVIVVERPEIEYPIKLTSTEEVIKRVREILDKG